MIYLTVPLLHFYGYASAGFWRMEETFRNLEKFCDAKVDTSSDIVALLRFNFLHKPYLYLFYSS